MARPTS
jgi:hypothetical protein